MTTASTTILRGPRFQDIKATDSMVAVVEFALLDACDSFDLQPYRVGYVARQVSEYLWEWKRARGEADSNASNSPGRPR